MTEAEAKTKWCPHSRTAEVYEAVSSARQLVVVSNRDEHENLSGYCVGSECMAWRWQHNNPTASTGHGYCGLAGRP